MISVEDAVNNSLQFFRRVYKDTVVQNVRVEEAELSDDREHWQITLGFDVPETSVLIPAYSRSYKTFTVDATSGQVESMRIRVVQ